MKRLEYNKGSFYSKKGGRVTTKKTQVDEDKRKKRLEMEQAERKQRIDMKHEETKPFLELLKKTKS